jgi:hypothetical protein
VFRLLVGQASLLRDGAELQSWGVGDTLGAAARARGVDARDVRQAEQGLELVVSRYIGELPFVFLPLAELTGMTRAFVERNAIALLSNFERPAVDPPSLSWLGAHSSRERVRNSGLWNNRHVDETHAPEFLEELERRVKAVRREAPPKASRLS